MGFFLALLWVIRGGAFLRSVAIPARLASFAHKATQRHTRHFSFSIV
jgi:hypothetical protein